MRSRVIVLLDRQISDFMSNRIRRYARSRGKIIAWNKCVVVHLMKGSSGCLVFYNDGNYCVRVSWLNSKRSLIDTVFKLKMDISEYLICKNECFVANCAYLKSITGRETRVLSAHYKTQAQFNGATTKAAEWEYSRWPYNYNRTAEITRYEKNNECLRFEKKLIYVNKFYKSRSLLSFAAALLLTKRSPICGY